jgi:hypothetical protein
MTQNFRLPMKFIDAQLLPVRPSAKWPVYWVSSIHVALLRMTPKKRTNHLFVGLGIFKL